MTVEKPPEALPLRCCGRCEHYVFARNPVGDMIRECHESPPTAYPLVAKRGERFVEIGRVSVWPSPPEEAVCAKYVVAKGNLVRAD